MKFSAVLLGLVLVSSFSFTFSGAFADVVAPDAAPTLQDDMKKIGPIFKALQAQAQDPTQNQLSATYAAQLVALFTDAQTRMPDSIAQLPLDQQADALNEYKQLIQNEIDDALALQKAFLANDNATALTLLSQMASTRQEGHGKFAN